MQYRHLVDLDEHTDWVNQIKLIEQTNTLLSCSNDATVKVWRLKDNEEYMMGEATKNIKRQGAFSTLKDHSDYVRAIDYS